MSPLRLFTSNRLEELAQALAEILKEPLASPLDPEIIVVQSRGMEHWLSMQLARDHGICANTRFPFPNRFVDEVFQALLPDADPFSPFDPKILCWRIMAALPSLLDRPGFGSLRRYLQGARRDLKLFQLSDRIADTFDQYLLFRPEMIFRWEEGKDDHWQAALWRELVKGYGDLHRASRGRAFFKALEGSQGPIHDLPERVSVFGISALPGFHVQILAGISRVCRVSLFLMNPSEEYWGDILSDWEIRRTVRKETSPDIPLHTLHFEKGNSLLASMGTLGREFFDLIEEFNCETRASFREPGEEDLLSCIQSDILHLRERQPVEKKTLQGSALSVEVHACHSPMREIEVLQDRLLAMFEADPGLMPDEILVMIPDIDAYAPYIHAVFDLLPGDPRRIPFSIADRSMQHESVITGPFLTILDLPDSRFGASGILAILESEAVRSRFDLAEPDLDRIRRWVDETRIRWGTDGEGRQRLGLPSFPENTWRAGLERLLMGYAMTGDRQGLFRGRLPYDPIEGVGEGEGTRVLGGLFHFVEQLIETSRSLEEPRPLDAWAETLMGLLDRFFRPGEEAEAEIQVIRRILNEMSEVAEAFNPDRAQEEILQDVDRSVIRWHLERSFRVKGFGSGFMTGGVTFCAMLPMRSIPFKVICLAGMNNDAYPRESRPPGFDLMAAHPKPGDRSRRNDDRYLFLEAILSSRQRLYISFVGQSIQDNSTIPPSVLVSELLDTIEQGFQLEEGAILKQILTRHRLQPFSPDYFKGREDLFSYSREHCDAAQALLDKREEAQGFISEGLFPPTEEWGRVTLDDLCRFYSNPIKYLLQRRLGLDLEERTSVPGEREAFELSGLERYLLEKDLLERRLEGVDLQDLMPVMRAAGRLPHGTVGECLYEKTRSGIERFAEKIQSYLQGEAPGSLEVDLQVNDMRLTGRITGLYSQGLIRYRYARLRPADHLRAWIHHLALNGVRAEGRPEVTVLAGLDPAGKGEPGWTAWGYGPVRNWEEPLEKLMALYQEGLVKPLHFSPESSWVYVENLMERNRSSGEALQRARKVWSGNPYARGEGMDPYVQRCFGDGDPLDSIFMTLAVEVFGPLMGLRQRIE